VGDAAATTAAEFVVSDPDAVRALLEAVVDARAGAGRLANAGTAGVA
jgi:hypothetical protein